MRIQNEKLIQLVERLSADRPVDGETLGQELGVSRAAIWKQIQRLGELGVQIESHKGQGYRLVKPLRLLNPQIISAELRELCPTLQLEVFESLTSSNEYLRLRPASSLCAVLAEQQTAGRGRFGRVWQSPFAENLYLSMGYPFQGDLSRLSGLSLVVGLAVCKALTCCYPELDNDASDLQLKWPNDIYWQGQKLGGILIEAKAEMNGDCYLVIGLGLNVNMTAVPAGWELPHWASLTNILGASIDRNPLSAALIGSIHGYLKTFETEGLEPFLEEWESFDYLHGKRVSVLENEMELQGVVVGINATGQLKLETDQGQLVLISAGEATIRKS